MREYFKTNDKQFIFKPKTFNEMPKQQIVKIKNLSKIDTRTEAKDWNIVKLDQNRFFVYTRNALSGYHRLISDSDAYMGLINFKEKTLKDINPPTSYSSEIEKNNLKTYPMVPGFCKLKDEIVAVCAPASSGANVCVLVDETWEFAKSRFSLRDLGGRIYYDGLVSVGSFYDYTKDGGFEYNNTLSSSWGLNLKAVPVGKSIVKEATWSNITAKTWNKTGVQGLVCPVNLEAGWVEGNTHYAFDGGTLIITEFIQDNVIEIKE